jgi:hypothetical protein
LSREAEAGDLVQPTRGKLNRFDPHRFFPFGLVHQDAGELTAGGNGRSRIRVAPPPQGFCLANGSTQAAGPFSFYREFLPTPGLSTEWQEEGPLTSPFGRIYEVVRRADAL